MMPWEFERVYLAVYRPPFEDELLYGWLSSLAAANYPHDIHGIAKIVDLLFPYSKKPENRERIMRDPIRMDFMRGLSENVKNIRALHFPFPDTAAVLAYNTPLIASGITKSSGEQARYIHTACATVTGDLFEMPIFPQIIDSIRICPECLKESGHIRTWHQLPDVEICAKHGTPLRPIDLKTFRERNIIKWDKEKEAEVKEDAFAYAGYVKSIYDHPSEVTLKDIAQSLMNREDRISFEDAKRLTKRNVPFPWLVRILMEREPNYAAFIKRLKLEKEDPKEMVRLGIGGVAEFQCPHCYFKWTDSVEAVRLGFGCPFCMGFQDPDKFINGLLHTIGDGQYKLIEPFAGMGATQSVLHETCGHVWTGRLSTRIWQRSTCRCEQRWSARKMQKKVDAVAGKGAFTVLDYTPNEGTLKVRHNACGSERSLICHAFLTSPHCPDCKILDMTSERTRRMMANLGDEYELVKGGASSKTVTVRHKPCGQLITGKPDGFLYGERHCPLCVPYRTEKRDGRMSVEGELYQEMQNWFKTHRTWVKARHRPSKARNEAIGVLVKKGYIYRVAYGIYSYRNDLSVYDILEEKFLLDDDGNPAGEFTGDTAKFLAGEISEEPEIITLESLRVHKYTHSTAWLCGRQIKIRGINRASHSKFCTN